MPWSNNGGGPTGGGPTGGDPRASGPRGGGPWGGGGAGGGRGGRGGGQGPWGGGPSGPNGSGRGPGGGMGGGQGPNLDDFFKRGQDQLKTVLGDRSGGGIGILLLLLALAGAWLYVSVYQVKPDEQAVVMTFGEFTRIDGPGLNFAPWPVQTSQIRAVTREQIISLGTTQGGAGERPRGSQRDAGLMLTGDENIIDINFQVAWNIRELNNFLFNLATPEETIQAVAESAMREVVGRSELQPLLNRDRAILEASVRELIQATLDDYEAGVNILRVNLDRADPPADVRDSFLQVQAAEQERDTLQKQAQAYFNQRTAGARGEAAQILEEAEGYRARVVAEAEGEAARFEAVLAEYQLATDVTRRRLYIETMERVFGNMNKIIIDENSSQNGQGVVPYLPLDQLQRRTVAQSGQQ